MERQDGCFLFSGNVSQPIVDAFNNKKLYGDIKNIKFTAPCSWNKIYAFLNKMNINGRTIYGDLEGLSKSIKQAMLEIL